MAERYICIHGHFYQPPRENPWLEAIEMQDSAYPYHDWNERIAAECYGPNGSSRILDSAGRIEEIVNNYSRISFNFGPTLLGWLEAKAPETYRAVLAADEESRKNFSGHGSAIAQPYNHVIMPLANSRDKETQVIWGIRDFERRFRRRPEGMWLPETAVDMGTLDVLAQQGIKFTILSPYQAARVRPIGARTWRDTSDGRIDPSIAYRIRLRYGRMMNVFFYDGPISRSVAFEGLLDKGEALADRLLGAFSPERDWPQLVHIATDGETYGHHHAYGDMALAYALRYIETKKLAKLTNYGEFLDRHPATHEVRIIEKSSWSCPHGVERWRSNCGCNSGMHPEWHQEWRGPLREALDGLRDEISPLFARKGKAWFKNPWLARNDYVEVILDRSRENVSQFLARHAIPELGENKTIEALKLMELQRHLMLMYTSCGWFFDELSGIETVQVIQYAGRAIQLAQELFGKLFEPDFLDRLEKVKSNTPEHPDGRAIFEAFVRPAAVNLKKVGAHYAVSSLFEHYNHEARIYCYNVDLEDYNLLNEGKTRLAVGRAKISSEVTWESSRITFGVLHLGDHYLNGGVREFLEDDVYQSMVEEVTEVFERGDLREQLRIVDEHFGSATYTLKLLFRDQQHHILRLILQSALAEAEASYRQIYERGAPLMRFVEDLGLPQPRRFQIAAEFTLNAELQRHLQAEALEVNRVRAVLDETQRAGVPLDSATLEFSLRRNVEELARLFDAQPQDLARLRAFNAAVDVAAMLPFKVRLWQPQNVFYEVMRRWYPGMKAKAGEGDEDAQAWCESFLSLGDKLSVRVP